MICASRINRRAANFAQAAFTNLADQRESFGGHRGKSNFKQWAWVSVSLTSSGSIQEVLMAGSNSRVMIAFVRMADGNEVLFDVHDGTVVWDGRARRIAVDVAETSPWLGMGLLQAHRLAMNVEQGGSVKMTRLLRRRPK